LVALKAVNLSKNMADEKVDQMVAVMVDLSALLLVDYLVANLVEMWVVLMVDLLDVLKVLDLVAC
jgi:hypothetical protein